MERNEGGGEETDGAERYTGGDATLGCDRTACCCDGCAKAGCDGCAKAGCEGCERKVGCEGTAALGEPPNAWEDGERPSVIDEEEGARCGTGVTP